MRLGIDIFHRSLRPECSVDYEKDAQTYGADIARKWSLDGCGIASSAAVIESINRVRAPAFRLPSVTALCECYRGKAYIPGVGWIHKGLVAFAADFEVEAFNDPIASLVDVCGRLEEGWVPVVSVTMGFKGGEAYHNSSGQEAVRPKGGHLVVLTGFDVGKGFWVKDCQNPLMKDGDKGDAFIPWALVERSFSGKVIYFR